MQPLLSCILAFILMHEALWLQYDCREENGSILAVSLLFFTKKFLRKSPLVISPWPEVCRMVPSLRKEGYKAMEYLASFRSYT